MRRSSAVRWGSSIVISGAGTSARGDEAPASRFEANWPTR
jgi:hypothetical protein